MWQQRLICRPFSRTTRYYYYYYYYWTSIIKVSLSRKTSRTLYMVSGYQNISNLDFIGVKDDGGGGDDYKTCKAPVKSSPTNQHRVFYRLDVLPVAQPTVSDHWREIVIVNVCQVEPALTELIMTFDLLRNFLFESDEVKVTTNTTVAYWPPLSWSLSGHYWVLLWSSSENCRLW